MSSNEGVGYTDEAITRLELIFGAGFLSPGGAEEVAKIVEGIDVKGKEVLDIGVGIGGPACVLVENHGAIRVIGIDLEQRILDQAAATVASHGLGGRITLKHVEPGRLPFDDESFDVVFSKDTICHIPDKKAFFKEALRVLRPDGWIVTSDWYCSDDPFTEEMSDYIDAGIVSFALTPIQKDGSLLGDVGFVDHMTLDRNIWFTEFSRILVERLSGPDYAKMVAVLGQKNAEQYLSRNELRTVVTAQGQLRPGHLRGRKPASVNDRSGSNQSSR